ncbi:hypothetical protein PF010_g12708 [Phytophthora fragariae]|nr:hypothetical protein PF010_g12708 [Phytophthora fragariae]
MSGSVRSGRAGFVAMALGPPWSARLPSSASPSEAAAGNGWGSPPPDPVEYKPSLIRSSCSPLSPRVMVSSIGSITNPFHQ